MDLSVTVQNRNFTDPVAFPDVTFAVHRYGWAAVGGPDFAEIDAHGEDRALWSLLNWLRAPVEIRDARDQAVWWGYISSAEVSTGSLQIGVDLGPWPTTSP